MSRAPLSRATWLLIAGEAVSALGTGLVLPLTLIYLHQVRGIALPEVGFSGLFALGETFMAPTTSPLVNSLASGASGAAPTPWPPWRIRSRSSRRQRSAPA
jgi:hypothetical protein